jgi:DNA polymerase-3 subunit beta
MKLQLDRQSLFEALQLVSGAVEKRQTLAVLSNILFQSKDNNLRLTGTDLEVELSVEMQQPGVEEAGEVTLPARKIVDIVKTLPNDKPVSITQHDDGRATIQSGRSRFTLSTLPASDFPHLEEGVATAKFSIPCVTLSEMIDRTHFAMAQQDVRYYLNGMLFEVDSGKLRTVATDGHRLTLAEWQQAPEDIELAVIVPRKGVLELGRLVSGRADNVELTIGNNHIRAEVDGVRFTSKLIDGKFPDYDRVIPKNSDKKIKVNKDKLKEGLQKAAILSNEKFKGVRLVLDEEGIGLFSNNPEQEEAEIHITAEIDGDLLEIGFNVQYLLEVLNSCKVEDVEINLGDVNSSCLIQEIDGSDAIYVIMPMRL